MGERNGLPAPGAGASGRAPRRTSSRRMRAAASGERRMAEIPGYRIERRIGRGATGLVCLATQLSMGREVALKILRFRASERPRFAERFVDEARALARLNHPNVVSVIDAGRAGELVYFAMEYIDGGTAQALLREKGPLPAGEAIRILLGIARGLEHAEKHGLIHRDVKPENVMLASDGRVLLLDLGLARAGAGTGDGEPADEGSTSSQRRRVTMAEGTPAYMAPEQARGRMDLDIRADLYALGATAFHLLTGEIPFDGDTAEAIMRQHVTAPFPSLDAERPGLPPDLLALVEELTEKDRDLRPRHAREVVERLVRLERGASSVAPPTATAPPVWQRPGVLVGAAAVLVALLLAAWPNRDDTPPGGSTAGGEAPSAQTRRRPQQTPTSGAEARDPSATADDPDAAGREVEAALALRRLLDEIASQELADRRAAAKLRALAAMFPGTESAERAQAAAETRETRARARFHARLTELRALADDLTREGAFDEAEGALGALAAEAKTAGEQAALRAAQAEVEARCGTAWRNEHAEAQASWEAGDLAAAKARVEAFAKRATKAGAARARAALAGLAGPPRPKEPAARDAAVKAALARSLALLRAGDLAGARAVTKKVLAETPAGTAAPALTARDALLARVQAADAAIATAWRQLIGEPARAFRLLDGLALRGVVQAYGADERHALGLVPDGRTDLVSVPLGLVSQAEVSAVLGAPVGPDEAKLRFARGLALLYAARAPEAAAPFLQAPAGIPTALPPYLKNDLEAEARTAPERRAAAHLVVAAARAAGERWEETLSALEALFGPLGKTKLVTGQRAAIIDLYARARLDAILEGAPAAFFAGKVTGTGRRFRVTYTFTSKALAADWLPEQKDGVRALTSAFRFKGWTRWRGRMLGDVALEVVLPRGKRARGAGFVIGSGGPWTGWLSGVWIPAEKNRVYRMSELAGSKAGNIFRLPGHVIGRLAGSWSKVDWAFATRGPGLAPNAPVKVVVRYRSRRVRFQLDRVTFPSVRVPEPPTAGGIAVVTGDRAIDIAAIRISGELDPDWLREEAVRRARAEAKARFSARKGS